MEWWRNSFWLYSVPSPHCLACPLLALSTKFEGAPKLRNGNQNQTRIHSTSLLKENNYVKGSVRELHILQQTRYLLTFRNTTVHRHPKFKKVYLSLDFPDLVFTKWNGRLSNLSFICISGYCRDAVTTGPLVRGHLI